MIGGDIMQFLSLWYRKKREFWKRLQGNANFVKGLLKKMHILSKNGRKKNKFYEGISEKSWNSTETELVS